jgi:hypothetical protein
MNSKLKDYILAEARTDWISELIRTPEDEQHLCDFVRRITLDALWFPIIANLYLNESNE